MQIDFLTLFPQTVDAYCKESIIKLAQEKKLIDITTHNPRDFSTDKHKRVDDTPYGGGAGMLIGPQAYIDCLESICEPESFQENSDSEIIITTAQGQTFNQDLAQKLSQKKRLVFLCGRYEGLDQRIANKASLEVSLGDFILTGGELAALTIMDASIRLMPGVLGDDASAHEESFSKINYLEKCKELNVSKKELKELIDKCQLKSEEVLSELSLLEYPHYTRPADFRGEKIPKILESGDHKKIFLWRLEQAIEISKKKRPDLLQGKLKST